jgi:hypothetical protein
MYISAEAPIFSPGIVLPTMTLFFFVQGRRIVQEVWKCITHMSFLLLPSRGAGFGNVVWGGHKEICQMTNYGG